MRLSIAVTAVLLGQWVSTGLATTISYDATTGMPASPPFYRMDNVFLNGYNAAQSVSDGVYSMGPTDSSRYTFWYASQLTLDHTQTVEVAARLRLVAESSSSTDRAGLALGLTDDRNYYQELYINQDEVFISKEGRIRDQTYTFPLDDNAGQWHDYLLRLQGDTVGVFVDGVQRLTGTVFQTANTVANWAVVGDITSSAQSTFEMTNLSVSVVPEPGTLEGLAAFAAVLVMAGFGRATRRLGVVHRRVRLAAISEGGPN